jgi:hypothetical protein
MAKALTLLVVFFLSVNLFSGMLITTGAAATLGIDAETGESAAADDLTGNNDVATGSPTDGTLFGLYNVVSSQVAGVFEFIFPGLAMLGRLGVPNFIINVLGGVFSLILTLGIASFIRGFDL